MTMDVDELVSPESVETQIAAIHDRIRRNADDIRALLRDDLPAFVAREVKARFVEDADLSSRMSEAQIKALKESTTRLGAELATQVDASLEPLDPWLAGIAVEDGGKHLEENPDLWARIARPAAEAVEEVLDASGFPRPASGHGVAYKEPARFIAGRYLPTLAERYWKAIAELRRINEQSEAQHKARSRSELARRWDDA